MLDNWLTEAPMNFWWFMGFILEWLWRALPYLLVASLLVLVITHFVEKD